MVRNAASPPDGNKREHQAYKKKETECASHHRKLPGDGEQEICISHSHGNTGGTDRKTDPDVGLFGAGKQQARSHDRPSWTANPSPGARLTLRSGGGLAEDAIGLCFVVLVCNNHFKITTFISFLTLGALVATDLMPMDGVCAMRKAPEAAPDLLFPFVVSRRFCKEARSPS